MYSKCWWMSVIKEMCWYCECHQETICGSVNYRFFIHQQPPKTNHFGLWWSVFLYCSEGEKPLRWGEPQTQHRKITLMVSQAIYLIIVYLFHSPLCIYICGHSALSPKCSYCKYRTSTTWRKPTVLPPEDSRATDKDTRKRRKKTRRDYTLNHPLG